MTPDEKILIVDGARTPIGSFGIVSMRIGGGQALAALFRRY